MLRGHNFFSGSSSSAARLRARGSAVSIDFSAEWLSKGTESETSSAAGSSFRLVRRLDRFRLFRRENGVCGEGGGLLLLFGDEDGGCLFAAAACAVGA